MTALRRLLRFFGFGLSTPSLDPKPYQTDAENLRSYWPISCGDGVQPSDPVIAEMCQPGRARNAKGQFMRRIP